MANNYYFKVNKGLSLTPQTTPPTVAKKGDLYFDDVLNLLQSYNGTSWSNVGGGGATLTIGTGLNGGSYDGTTAVTIDIDNTVVATLTDSQALTNKTIDGTSNTLSNIGNSSLTNSSITVNGSSISLGGSATITASTTNALTIGTGLSGTSFNGGTAVTIAIDSTVATLTGTQSLTNKSIGDALTFAQITTPANPSAGFNKLYVKADGSFYSLNSSGTETIVGEKWTITASTSLGAGGTISISLSAGLQAFRVASSGGAVTLSITPFGASAPATGTCIRLMGTSDTNTVTISNNNASKGCILNGTATLGQYDMIELQYNSDDDRYVEVSRNF
jgi:hypothetical protein